MQIHSALCLVFLVACGGSSGVGGDGDDSGSDAGNDAVGFDATPDTGGDSGGQDAPADSPSDSSEDASDAIADSMSDATDATDGADAPSDVETDVLSDFAPTSAGEIVISEVMQNPNAIADDEGEWFEVHNPSDTMQYNLRGCVFTDFGTDSFTVVVDAVIDPGGYATFATSDAPGFTPDVDWEDMGTFFLANGDDEIILSCGGVAIDALAYDGGPAFPDAAAISMSLDPDFLNATDNDDATHWCESTATDYDGTNVGTPGEENPSCAGMSDAGSDAAVDAPGDAAMDVGSDAATDAGSDALMDAPAPIAPGAGDIVVTEVMQNPGAPVNDSVGEWFEFKNVTTDTITLEGCTVTDDAIDSFTIDIELTVAPGGYATFAISDSPGFTPDFVWTGLQLGNGNDELILTCDGVEIDRVEYDNGMTFPDPNGASMSLNPTASSATSNDDGTSWCEATSLYDATNTGTPGAENDAC